MSKKITILGAGESGMGAALLAKAKGLDVFVSDAGLIKDKFLKELKDNNIDFEQGKHSYDKILSADEVIKSPGVPDKADIILKIKDKGINIISEIEFASRYTTAKKICITGSNGKTTTTLLTYEILKNAGYDVALAGNVGVSMARKLTERDYKYFVIELSSFQLDYMFEFKAEYAILLNITPDHLDRYEYDFQKYIDSKFRITQNQTKKDFFIYCADDPVISDQIMKRPLNAVLVPFTLEKQNVNGAYIDENKLIIDINNKDKFTMFVNELSIKGKHNTYNSMAAGITARLADIRKEVIRESFKGFKGVEHRLEEFISIRGVKFINDSKATNVNSVWYALESVDPKIILILGGIDKGNDYSIIKDLVRQKVKAIIALGSDNSNIHKAFDEIVEVYDVNNMEDAVKSAFLLAEQGDTVLLSPACASFDLFENYEDRGKKFKDAVRRL